MAITVFGGGGGGGSPRIPQGIHSTSSDTLAHYRPTAPNSLLLDSGAGGRDFALSEGGWWDFGHPDGYLANIVAGRVGTDGGRIYSQDLADDDRLQPSWRNANTGTGYAITFAASFCLLDSGADRSKGTCLVNHSVTGGWNQEYRLATNTSGILWVGRDTAAGWDATGDLGGPINSNEWFHVVYTQNAAGTAGAVWYNGVKSTFTSAVSNKADASGRTNILYEQANKGTGAVFNPIFESGECSDVRAAELYSDHNIF